jgi:hypothetical protein
MRSVALGIFVASCTARSAHSPTLGNQSSASDRDPVALAILFNGQAGWVGTDDNPDEDTKLPGALHDLERGIDGLRLPPGSEVMVIEYSVGAKVVVPWTHAEALRGRQLGEQPAYEGKIGVDLVEGVNVALDALVASESPHKLLLVVGDGNDTNNETARAKLTAADQRARDAHVSTAAIIWRSAVSGDVPEVVHLIAPSPRTLNTTNDLGPAVVDSVAARVRP